MNNIFVGNRSPERRRTQWTSYSCERSSSATVSEYRHLDPRRIPAKQGQSMTKTVRSRFNHDVGENVEGCKILEKVIVAPPNEVERRRGIYDYLVEAKPAVMKATAASREVAPARESY